MTRPLVILLPSLAHGGAQKVFLEIASYLSDKHIEVVLVVLDKDGALVNRLPENLNVMFLDGGLSDKPFIKRFIQWFRLRRLIAQLGAVDLYSTITGMNVFTLSCFFFSKKINITIREATTLENNNRLYLQALIWLFYRRSNKVICTSNFIQTQLIQRMGLNPERVIKLPNPIDIERIKKYATEQQDERCIFSGQFRIVAVGRLIKAKGFDVLIQALSIARKTEDIKLVIVGDGPERANLEKSINQLGLVDDVMLVGYQPNPYPYIYNSDLFVLSSRWEGYVNTVIEAMALNVDVVMTDCKSGPGELLQDKLNYKLVPVESAEKLAEAILDALLNPKDTSKFNELLEEHTMSHAIRRYFGEDIAKKFPD